jgi:hypothetical protein
VRGLVGDDATTGAFVVGVVAGRRVGDGAEVVAATLTAGCDALVVTGGETGCEASGTDALLAGVGDGVALPAAAIATNNAVAAVRVHLIPVRHGCRRHMR